jgi:hypothetical protein
MNTTHNTCTKEQCVYNLKEKDTLASTTSTQKIICQANLCIGCGTNMGDCNPRQYCYKTYCPFEDVIETASS